MNVGEQQRAAIRVKQLRGKLEIATRQLKKLQDENEQHEHIVQNMNAQCDLLHEDIRQLNESRGSFESVSLDSQMLRRLGDPMNWEMVSAAELQRKLAELRVIASRLLICTAFNEEGAHKQLAEEERRFSERMADSLEARRLLTEEIRKAREKSQLDMQKKADLWQEMQIIEQRMHTMESKIWMQKLENERKKQRKDMIALSKQNCKCESEQTKGAKKAILAPCNESPQKKEVKEAAAMGSLTYSMGVNNEMLVENEAATEQQCEPIRQAEKEETRPARSIASVIRLAIREEWNMDIPFNT